MVTSNITSVDESQAKATPRTRTSLEVSRRLRLAQVLEDALSELRSIQKTRDYFTGYSLVEALTERIDLIGSSTDPEAYIGHRRTLIAELTYFKTTTLAAIEEAKKLGEMAKLVNTGEDLKSEVQKQ